MKKIVSKQDFRNLIRPGLKKEGKVIALCHGVFDLVHPGHMIHFEQAKAMCDILVVSITSEKYVRKGPGRPYFNDEMRMRFLEGIECIDYVMLSEQYTVDDIVGSVKPDIYVKGQEYADEKADVTENIGRERELVEAYGGRIEYTSGEVFSSTKIINTAMAGLSDDVMQYMMSFKERFSIRDVRRIAEKAQHLRLLVIGDVIIDRYTYCTVQGLMSKDMGYSARMKSSEQYFGGAAAVARHLSSFSDSVTFLSIMGEENDIHEQMNHMMGMDMKLEIVHSSYRPTIIKHRYLIKNEKREEYRKVFEVNNLEQKNIYDEETRKVFKERLLNQIDAYDAVFLCDFGHGLIDAEVIDIVQRRARYLVLNCQTNSSNYGMNLITKYARADVFSLDQKELALAFPQETDESRALVELSRHLRSMGFLTRGSSGASCVDLPDKYDCPAFTLSVRDTVGAGDCFFSIAGLAKAAGASSELSLFLGNIAGALASNIVGNKEAIKKADLLKFASTLMNV